MGVDNSPDIFQHKMNELFHGFEFTRWYICDLLVLTKVDCTDHIQKLELPFNKLKGRGPKCNIDKVILRINFNVIFRFMVIT